MMSFYCGSVFQRKTTTRPRLLFRCPWRLMEERMFPCLQKVPWPTCYTGSTSRTTSPTWWHTQAVSARTRTTVGKPAQLPVCAPSFPLSQPSSQSYDFCVDALSLHPFNPNQLYVLRFLWTYDLKKNVLFLSVGKVQGQLCVLGMNRHMYKCRFSI